MHNSLLDLFSPSLRRLQFDNAYVRLRHIQREWRQKTIYGGRQIRRVRFSRVRGTLVAVASALIVVVVIGMPALQFSLLQRWKKPFDRLFVPNNEGHLVPSADGKDILGPLYDLYKPRFYLWALVDAAAKLVFTGVLGVVFKDAQQTGLVVSAIMCVCMGSCSVILMPFTHKMANYIVCATYAAVMANCAQTAVAFGYRFTEQTENARKLHTVLETLTFLLYVLPFALGLFDLFDVSKWPIYRRLKACVGKVATALCSVGYKCAARNDTRTSTTEHVQTREMALEVKMKDNVRIAQLDGTRSRAFAMLLSDLRPLADRAAVLVSSNPSAARTGKRKSARKDAVSNAVDAFNGAINAASKALGEFPLALTWKHWIDVESAARMLSKLVFEGRNDVMKVNSGKHGVIVLAFASVHALWQQEIAPNVCAQEADGDDTAVPSMKSSVVCRNVTIALLSPGADMGSFRMVVNASFRWDVDKGAKRGAPKRSAVLPVGTWEDTAVSNPLRHTPDDDVESGGDGETKEEPQSPHSQRLVRLTPKQREAALEASQTLDLLIAGHTPSKDHSPTNSRRQPPTTPVPVSPRSPRSSRSGVSALRFASPSLRGDMHVVLAAVRRQNYIT